MKRFSVIFLLLLLSGCTPASLSAWLDNSFKDFQLLPLNNGVEKAQAEIARALNKENYLHAFELLLIEKHNGRAENAFAEAWPQAINGLLDQAERQFRKREFAEAGQLFRRIERNLPQDTELRARIDLDRSLLRRRVEDCADNLLESGLLAYRNGELQQALEIWTDINRFHPTHKASQRAIRTTRLQLQNLEALPASSS